MTEEADFVVIKENCTPLLGNHTLQDMNLLHWNCENILEISNYTPITKEQLFTEYKPVFDGIGRLLFTNPFLKMFTHLGKFLLL